jgi:hypothetical protein
METTDRVRRVEALPSPPSSVAGAKAMLGRPSLASFPGSCAPRQPRAAPPANDTGDELVPAVEPGLPRPEPGELRLDDERAAPQSIAEFGAGIVASAADTMAMLAEHRATRPMSWRPGREARILALADAVIVTGERAMAHVLDWWERTREDGNAWTAWPPVFLLGLIAGPKGLLAAEQILETLRPEEAMLAQGAADALCVVPHPGVGVLVEDLLDSVNPVAQAVGVEWLSRRGGLDADRVASFLDAQAPALLAAALRAAVRVDAAAFCLDRTIPFLRHPDPDVCWEAARALTLWSRPEALDAVRVGDPLAVALGARATELFVMAGEAGDIAHIESVLTRSPVSAEMLDAIGRFGHPLAWSFLLHYLADRELAGAAETALLTLFGPLLPDEETRSASAWRDALAERDLDPAVRYRHGAPWTPTAVVHDCVFAASTEPDGTSSQRGVEQWLDELAARTSLTMDADLSLWTPDANAKLRVVSERALRAPWRAGAWTRARDIRGRRET